MDFGRRQQSTFEELDISKLFEFSAGFKLPYLTILLETTSTVQMFRDVTTGELYSKNEVGQREISIFHLF
jgi:hypothetical protein